MKRERNAPLTRTVGERKGLLGSVKSGLITSGMGASQSVITALVYFIAFLVIFLNEGLMGLFPYLVVFLTSGATSF